MPRLDGHSKVSPAMKKTLMLQGFKRRLAREAEPRKDYRKVVTDDT